MECLGITKFLKYCVLGLDLIPMVTKISKCLCNSSSALVDSIRSDAGVRNR